MKKLKTLLVWILLVVLFVVVFMWNQDQGPQYQEETSVFEDQVRAGEVLEVRANGNELVVASRSARVLYSVVYALTDDQQKFLTDHGVLIRWGEEANPIRSALTIILPLLVLLALVVFFVKRAQGGTTNILALRKSRARLIAEDSLVKFSDVGGCEDAKEQLSDIIDFLRAPERWATAGVRLTRGVLLEGPPGTGKTLLARAVAGETDAKFFLVSASEFVEMFVGVGASRVRDMFETAAKQAPSVIFIDELDAVGRRRGSGIGAGHDEREQTLNQLLVCLDGFEANDRVVVIAATNRPDILDQALLRPGRFDRRIVMPELDRDQRVEVLKIHTRNKQLDDDVSLEAIADRTDGRSGADLENLANEAALLAVRRTRGQEGIVRVGAQDFERALQPSSARPLLFSKLDTVLIESNTQLAQPTGRARVRLVLADDKTVEGDVVWADAGMLKLRDPETEVETIVPKMQIRQIEMLEGTEAEDPADISTDPWAGRLPDMA